MSGASVEGALAILKALGLPRAQQNERSALSLLALATLKPGMPWRQAQAALMGITPIMDFARAHYDKDYAPNTRETVRRQTMHQFVEAGVARYNPDAPARAVNSPKAAYQLSPEALALLQAWGSKRWPGLLAAFMAQQGSLAAHYAQDREQAMVALQLANGTTLRLSPGEHSQLIADIVQIFGPRFAPGARLVYAGDTGEKWGYRDNAAFMALGLQLDSHGKMPDVVLWDELRRWLFLIESVTSHGPVNPKRYGELATLFASAGAGCVYVTAFPNRNVMARYVADIAWETEVWVADTPAHLIHFNGDRFMGPR